MAYDSRRNVIVVQNGRVLNENICPGCYSYVTETWEWDGTDWHDKTSDYLFCCPGADAVMVYESARARMFLAGGLHYPKVVGDHVFILTTGNGRQTNYVDLIAGSIFGDGSLDFPFDSFTRAVNCSMGSATISIKTGEYFGGEVFIDRQMNIEARSGSVYLH
jgi:hypothetical protein